MPRGKMACVVVTFNPDPRELALLIARLAESQVSIYVVDNWFSDKSLEGTKAICSGYRDYVHLIPLDKNYGIAKALNTGVDMARNAKHDWVLLLDQDSLPLKGLLEEMQAVVERLAACGEQVAAIGPRLYDPRSGVFHKFFKLRYGIWQATGCCAGTGELIPCEFINSSGSLIFLRHWHEIGPFNEDFFIDHVETEWYMRVRHLGLKCYGYCSKSYMTHYMGDAVSRYWWWGWRYMPRRAPQRHYTIVRNAIWMWRMQHTPIAWSISNGLKILFTLGYFSLFDHQRREQFFFIVKGIRDGVFGRSLG